ncbi:DUF411 domain-containing protein [Colwellia psychrerythraea]|uniref:Metal-binding protein n=1 Tax=Colwellia psychrerythraea TaxID=28229 RepID=A0A099KLP0_COLPS|nr:DUF411 domain-containing protein [Colwellia psychrerythraea]KGJ90877.1 protein of unknown function DUF411 [Colwellia psychrerythraea]
MHSFSFPIKAYTVIATVGFILLLSACSEQAEKTAVLTEHTHSQISADKQPSQTTTALPLLEVYKSPTCGCCEKWLSHIEQHGFSSKAYNQTDLSTFKSTKGIKPQYRSCHTAVSKDGFVFEGHVPAKFIHQFLAKPPKNSIGLSVPAMPIGSPGMEVGDKFMPYQVILLKSDGSYEIYAKLNNYQEQF